MGKKIVVIGGDMRMIYLAELLEKENEVITFGLDTFGKEGQVKQQVRIRFNLQVKRQKLRRSCKSG